MFHVILLLPMNLQITQLLKKEDILYKEYKMTVQGWRKSTLVKTSTISLAFSHIFKAPLYTPVDSEGQAT